MGQIEHHPTLTLVALLSQDAPESQTETENVLSMCAVCIKPLKAVFCALVRQRGCCWKEINSTCVSFIIKGLAAISQFLSNSTPEDRSLFFSLDSR